MENQSKKILLLSDDPADVSFLSEIAVMQQADLELAANIADLCSKIATLRADQSLAAIFVDVTAPTQLRKFEHELQSKMGTALASELSKMTHFISNEALALNREVLLSPYFTFYSERKPHAFIESAQAYQQTFYKAEEYIFKQSLGFDQKNQDQFFERMKRELLSKGSSAEWIIKFKSIVNELIELNFPSRFDCSFIQTPHGLRVAIHSKDSLNKENFRIEKLLHFGVSAIFSSKVIILFIPIFKEVADAVDAFKFYKVET